MVSQLARKLRARLRGAAVIVESERRGRDPWPGRPDSVFWLRPSGLAVNRVVPLLVELEGAGNYHASKTDVREFAKRHDPTARPERDDFQYHLNLPTMDRAWAEHVEDEHHFTKASAPITLPVEYQLFALPSSTVTGEPNTNDAALHQSLEHPFCESRRRHVTPQGFDVDAQVTTVGRTEFVHWIVGWRLPGGNTGTLSVPFVVSAGSDLEATLREEIQPISVPMAAVIDGAPSAHVETRRYETGVRFPYLSPANVTDLNDEVGSPR